MAGMITGIILASGFSRRMKTEKLLLEVDGTPMVERVIQAAKASLLDEVVLVYQNENIKKVGEKYGIKTVYNEHANAGQSASIKLGVEAASAGTDGFIFLMGDQPFLNAATINTVIDVFNRNPRCIIVPVYNGKRGNPVIFPSALKDDLLALEGDRGGRALIEKMPGRLKLVTIEDERMGIDVDTEEDYECVRNRQVCIFRKR
jgi:molybdenum cofactor cytidylyltransferase